MQKITLRTRWRRTVQVRGKKGHGLKLLEGMRGFSVRALGLAAGVAVWDDKSRLFFLGGFDRGHVIGANRLAKGATIAVTKMGESFAMRVVPKLRAKSPRRRPRHRQAPQIEPIIRPPSSTSYLAGASSKVTVRVKI